MNTDQQIYQVAAQLLAENKTPTVALIRARLPANVPLAIVIKGLQVWQKNPDIAPMTAPIDIENKADSTAITQETIRQLITEAVTPLQQQIIALKAEITILKKALVK